MVAAVQETVASGAYPKESPSTLARELSPITDIFEMEKRRLLMQPVKNQF